jgi:hypothetical protein
VLQLSRIKGVERQVVLRRSPRPHTRTPSVTRSHRYTADKREAPLFGTTPETGGAEKATDRRRPSRRSVELQNEAESQRTRTF